MKIKKIKQKLNKTEIQSYFLKLLHNTYKVFLKNDPNKQLVFILGCQRSGTTLMTDIFFRDFNAKVYGEFSELSQNDINKIRLDSFESVESKIYQQPHQLVVLKPLVESQNALKLLEYFKQSKIIWVYRDFLSVVSSNLKKFGLNNGLDDIRPIANDVITNWRSEFVSKETSQIIKNYFSESMNPYDAAALFWYARNKLFFDLKLYENKNVFLCKYENLVSNPKEEMKRIYTFLGKDYPGDKILKSIHKNSIRKGKDISISENIKALCEKQYLELEKYLS